MVYLVQFLAANIITYVITFDKKIKFNLKCSLYFRIKYV